MDELEQRLRSALTELAEEVPSSRHPWAEHQRRLAKRKSRRPFLMGLVAATVMASVAVPVVVLQTRSGTVQIADIPEPTPQPGPENPDTSGSNFPAAGAYRPQPGETVLTQPVAVLYEGADSEHVRTFVYTTQQSEKRFLCLAKIKGQAAAVINGAVDSVCSLMTPPRAGRYVWISRLVSSSTHGGQMLYVASEPTDSLLVRKTEGTYGVAHRIAQATGFTLFSVDLGSNNPPLAYTARDKANVSLENG
ncbi:MAG: hypothetical protein ABW224_25085 [Kibdelosporangium sp.]